MINYFLFLNFCILYSCFFFRISKGWNKRVCISVNTHLWPPSMRLIQVQWQLSNSAWIQLKVLKDYLKFLQFVWSRGSSHIICSVGYEGNAFSLVQLCMDRHSPNNLFHEPRELALQLWQSHLFQYAFCMWVISRYFWWALICSTLILPPLKSHKIFQS